MSLLRPILLTIPMLMLACAADGDPVPMSLGEPVDQPPSEYRDWGPPMTNTHGLNGFDVAALDTQGSMHDGWQLLSVEIRVDGSSIADHPVYEVHVEDGLLYGIDQEDEVFSGPQFVGSVWTVLLDGDGSIETMEISDFIEDGDRSRYEMFFGGFDPNPETFTCPQDLETGEYSVFVFADLDVDRDSGTHFERPSTIYFGCTAGAVGKSALWGYSPWATSDGIHQTASRAVRADYCGDGTSYTIVGTELQMTDVLGINVFVDSGHATEALWGPEGAECLLEPRLQAYVASDVVCPGRSIPECQPSDTLNEWPKSYLWSKTWH